MIILGIMMALVGRKFFSYTIAVFGAMLGFGTTFLLFFMISMLEDINTSASSGSYQTEDSTSYTAMKLLIAIITGLFVGFILT